MLLSGMLPACAAATGCVPGAHVFCVTSSADDAIDPAPGQGTGTLRQAIVDANAAGGADTIEFAIANPPGPHTIALTRALPAFNPNSVGSVVIDGYSQAGSAMNTNAPDQGGLNAQLMIELVGSGSYTGFTYPCCAAPYFNLTVQGIAMHGFGSAIAGQQATLTPKAKLTVYGCFIGTTIDGSALPSEGNSGAAVAVGYDDAQIGGAQAWQRNLLSGSAAGVYASGPNASVIVEGNLIGTDAAGTQSIPNGTNSNWPGIVVAGNLPGIRLGCTGAGCLSAASRNVISGNHTYGVGIWDSYSQILSGLQIKGNFIGTDWTGNAPLPNGDATAGCPTYCGGIQLQGSQSIAKPAALIGGFNPEEGNLIAYNNGAGIVSAFGHIGESFDNQANAIHNNRNTNVAFVLQGRLPNDAGDADTGTNNQQNWPVIQSASVSGGQLTVTYYVDSSSANSAYPLRVDFFVDVDEGSGAFLVSDIYPASSAQLARTVSLPLPMDAQTPAGLVAAATDANNYSSELSPSYVFDRIFASEFE
ncbi:MAG TPA: hypothetical protein VN599_08425 [Rudaea sp.]|nr:hypothetical protein [Rudaea sp.]